MNTMATKAPSEKCHRDIVTILLQEFFTQEKHLTLKAFSPRQVKRML
jgi:hypothetical protein